MLNYYTLPCDKRLSQIVNNYIVFEGGLLPGFVYDQVLTPVLWEFIYFNLTETPQAALLKGTKIILQDSLVASQYSQAYRSYLSGHVKMIGVQIKVSGLSRLFNAPLHYLSNNPLTLQELVGNKTRWVNEEIKGKEIMEVIPIIEKFLIASLLSAKVSPTHQTLLHSLALINGAKGKKSVKELALETRTSEKTLQRIFLSQVGLTPKLYTRIHKFNEVIWYFNTHKKISPDFIEELGYFDQAHFLHDFKNFSGQCPSVFFKNHLGLNEFFTGL